MKDEPRKPLEALGDKALEARVVAWVLGEASAFESAELEERCAQDTELKRFAVRMRELHRLIDEDGEAPGNVEKWQLPDAKRRKVVDLLGVEPVSRPEVRRRRFPLPSIALAAAACLMIGLMLWGMSASMGGGAKRVPYSMGETRGEAEGVARNEPKPYPTGSTSFEVRDVDDLANLVMSSPSDIEQTLEHDHDGVVEVDAPVETRFVGGREFDSFAATKGEARVDQFDTILERSDTVETGSMPAQVATEPMVPASRVAGVQPPSDVPSLSSVPGRNDLVQLSGGVDSGNPGQDFGGPDAEVDPVGSFGDERRSGLTFLESDTKEGGSRRGMVAPQEGLDSIVGAGNRSGDGAIARNSINSILNRPVIEVTGGQRTSADFIAPVPEMEPKGERYGVEPYGKDRSWNDDSLANSDRFTWSLYQQNRLGDQLRLDDLGADLWGRADDSDALVREFSNLAADDNFGMSSEIGDLDMDGRIDFGLVDGTELGLKMDREVFDLDVQAAADPADNGMGGGGFAQREMARRMQDVEASDKLRDRAREAYADGDYQQAAEKYKESLASLPEAPRRGKRRDFLEKSLADAEVARAEELRRVGRYAESEALVELALERNPESLEARRMKGKLEEPIRSNAATSHQHGEKVDEIRRELYDAEGAYELGKFDQAKGGYEKALEIDPYNRVARRGLERVESAKPDYYRASYDQTRADLLSQVDKAWELEVPADGEISGKDSLTEAERRLNRVKEELAVSQLLQKESKAASEPAPQDQELAELRDAVQKQQDAVADKRKILSTIMRNQELIYRGLVPGGAREGGLASDEEARMAATSYADLSEQKIMLDSQIETLRKYDDDQLMTYAAGVQLPENIIKELHPRYLEAKRGLDAMKLDGLGQDHPKYREQERTVERMRHDLDEGVVVLRETLKAQEELATHQLGMLAKQMAQKKEAAVKQGIGLHGFDDAMNDSEESERTLAELKARLAIAEGGAIKMGEPEALEIEVPKVDHSATLDAMAEISAEEEPFSTFSMHVSDASFKLAAAAVERGEIPAAESVRPEEFYNAFDYGDPAPTADQPVACVVEQCAHPAFPQRNLLRIAVRTGAEGRTPATPLNLTLLLDNSGSMEREDRAEGVRHAVEGLTSLLKDGDTITVAGFSRQPRLLADRLDGGQAERVNGLVEQTPAEGGTNLEEALVLGADLAKRQFRDGAQNRVVLFTDGAANLGDADPDSLNRRVEDLRHNGIAFDAAGFGADGLNDRLLERLTRNGNGRYYIVDDAGDADEGFAEQLAGAFRPAAENVKVQVVFNPARVGNYKLIGFEEHRLKKEDFRNDAVDAAEMASEEAGVALYQFEVLPEGEGEVGEVSVRFRDTATGEMVERSWAIPYDPQAPAFDQAKPGLQLAGMAAFVAEKMRRAPLAEAIDFDRLNGVMARVKDAYSGNDRVQQLERMMDQTR